MDALVRARVLVSGEVQGRGFRGYINRHAQGLGIKGWIRNLDDGRVEAVFQGEAEKVNQMLEVCKRGPPFAKVSDVKVSWQPPEENLKDFAVM